MFSLADFVKVLLAVAAEIQNVFQRHGAFDRARDEHLLAFRATDPVGELPHVWHGGGEEHEADVRRKHDDHLLPDDAALGVVDVVHLVEDDPLHVADEVRAAVQHRSQNFRGHDEARRVRLDAHVPREQPDVELLPEIAKLLVADGLDRRRVNRPRAVFRRQRERVLRHHRLPGGRVRRHEHALPALQTIHSLFLKPVQRERKRVRRFRNLPSKRIVDIRETFHHRPLIPAGVLPRRATSLARRAPRAPRGVHRTKQRLELRLGVEVDRLRRSLRRSVIVRSVVVGGFVRVVRVVLVRRRGVFDVRAADGVEEEIVVSQRRGAIAIVIDVPVRLRLCGRIRPRRGVEPGGGAGEYASLVLGEPTDAGASCGRLARGRRLRGGGLPPGAARRERDVGEGSSHEIGRRARLTRERG